MLELLATAFLIGHAARAPAQDCSLIPGRGSRELESHPSGLSGKAARVGKLPRGRRAQPVTILKAEHHRSEI